MPSIVQTQIQKSVTIQRAPWELYQYWRDLTHMPSLMPHIEHVELLDDRRSRWVAKPHDSRSIEWTSYMTEDIPNQRISWASEEGSTVEHSGSVSFKVAPGDKGTEVRLDMTYDPPGGPLGDLIATLFGDNPAQIASTGLKRLKARMEAGEEPTTEGQPRGTCSGHSVTGPGAE